MCNPFRSKGHSTKTTLNFQVLALKTVPSYNAPSVENLVSFSFSFAAPPWSVLLLLYLDQRLSEDSSVERKSTLLLHSFFLFLFLSPHFSRSEITKFRREAILFFWWFCLSVVLPAVDLSCNSINWILPLVFCTSLFVSLCFMGESC